MKRLWAGALAVSLALSGTAFGQDELAEEGGAAPRFRLPVFNPQPGGKTVAGLDDFVGPEAADPNTQLLIVSFMASFCAPCKKEMPYLQALHEQYGKHGLRVMMVSIDTEPEGQKKIDELIALNHVTFPVLKDRFNLVARRWLGAKSPLPSVFFLKHDGTISKVHRGYNEEASQQILAEIASALGVKPVQLSPSVAAAVPATGTVSTSPQAVVTPAKAVAPKKTKKATKATKKRH